MTSSSDDKNISNNNANKFHSSSDDVDVDEGYCKHYKNKCEILSPCCFKYYRCFRCHDENDNDDDENDENCDQQQSLDRSKVTKIRCIECKLEQVPSKQCKKCNIEFAEYVCLDCSLYRQNNSESGIFHCYDCGICRIGKGIGISHWHCNSCVACLTIDIDREEHTKICRPLSAQDDCCICFESMKNSQQELVMGKYCGHFLHKNCCEAYFRTGKIDCPICKRPLIEETFTSPRRIRIGIQWITNFVVYIILPAIISSFVTMHAISVVDMYCIDTGELLLSFWVVLVWLLLRLQLHHHHRFDGGNNQHQQGLHVPVPQQQPPWWLRWYTIVSVGILLSCSMCYFSVCIF